MTDDVMQPAVDPGRCPACHKPLSPVWADKCGHCGTPYSPELVGARIAVGYNVTAQARAAWLASQPAPEPAPTPDGDAAPADAAPEAPLAPGALWAAPSQAPAAPGAPVNWAAPPPAGPREVPGAPGFVFATTTTRFVAYVVDAIIVGIIGGIIGAILGASAYSAGQAPGGQLNTGVSILAGLIGLAFGFLYYGGSWSGGRRSTPGQRIFKIQVGNAFDGQPLTLTQALKRTAALTLASIVGLVVLAVSPTSTAAASTTGLLGIAWALVLLVTTASSDTRQGLHDRFANSAVVRPADAGSTTGLAVAVLIVIAVLVVLVLPVVLFVLLGSQISTILSNVGESV